MNFNPEDLQNGNFQSFPDGSNVFTQAFEMDFDETNPENLFQQFQTNFQNEQMPEGFSNDMFSQLFNNVTNISNQYGTQFTNNNTTNNNSSNNNNNANNNTTNNNNAYNNNSNNNANNNNSNNNNANNNNTNNNNANNTNSNQFHHNFTQNNNNQQSFNNNFQF